MNRHDLTGKQLEEKHKQENKRFIRLRMAVFMLLLFVCSALISFLNQPF